MTPDDKISSAHTSIVSNPHQSDDATRSDKPHVTIAPRSSWVSLNLADLWAYRELLYLLTWTFFSTAITSSGNSLVGNAHLITKIYFPRMIIPGAAVCAAAVDFLLAFVVLVPLMIYYHVTLTWQLALLPLLILVLMILALGVGTWMSALNVKYRDVRFALPFL